MNSISINAKFICKVAFGSPKIKKLSDEVSFLVTRLFKCLIKHYFYQNRFVKVRGAACEVEPERRQPVERILARWNLFCRAFLFVDDVMRLLQIFLNVSDTSVGFLRACLVSLHLCEKVV